MKKILNIILPAIVLFLLAGCNTLGPIANMSGGNNTNVQSVATDNILSMPKNASRIILAVSGKIADTNKNIKNVVFESEPRVNLPYAELFNLNRAALLAYNDQAGTLRAELFFNDTLGRTCAFLINASYIVKDKKIMVQKCKISEKEMPAENSVCFIFPAKEYKKLTKDTMPKSFYALYEYAAKQAVTPKKALKFKGKKEWVVMTFLMDRIPGSAKMELELSDKPGASDKGYDVFSRYLIYSGWRVGVIAGNFYLADPDSTKPLYAKVFCNSGGGLFASRKMIGRYKLR